MTREYWRNKSFQDRFNYPYGFSRSGDFTIKQSQLLEENGSLIEALLRDEVINPVKEDLILKKLILAGSNTDDELVNTWLKYAKIKARGKSMASFNEGGKKSVELELEVEVADEWDGSQVLGID